MRNRANELKSLPFGFLFICMKGRGRLPRLALCCLLVPCDWPLSRFATLRHSGRIIH